jgi:sulfur carrier protein
MTTASQINIIANGERFSCAEGEVLSVFLQRLGFTSGTVVVERNLEAVSPSEHASVRLGEGDRLEIVRIVAGG